MSFSGTGKLSLLLLCAFLTACAGKNGAWPTLAEPLPDPAERNRVETAPLPKEKPAIRPRGETQFAALHANPTIVERPAEAMPGTAAEAETLLASIKENLRAETLAYREAVAKFGLAAGDDRLDAWYDAQAALTRLSQTASRLDILTESDDEALIETAKAAGAEAGIIETFVVGERQRLASSKPQ